MTNKTLFSCLFALSLSSGVWAGPRTMQEAKALASEFMSETPVFSDLLDTDLRAVSTDAMVARAPQLYQAYYIFNIGENDGYVIVAGDDMARTILAYSDQGHIDVNNMPDNMRYWLDFYQAEITSIPDRKDLTAYAGGVDNPGTPVVNPLLKQIAWDQGAPYNDLCPTYQGQHLVTGCAATSMAMVMKYYEYPEKGTGSFNYTTQALKLPVSVTLGEKYDWDNMRDTYSGAESAAQKEAVATLMFHCGASLNMEYNTSSAGGSGASVFSHLPALVDNFGYNKNMYFLGRDYTTEGNWKTLIKAELDANRPILYSGQSSQGGHSFVLDGYTASDYYHFNWGWSGMYNGYYSLSSLAPGTGGTGAGAGEYNEYQFILLGAQPEETGSPKSGMYLDGTLTAGKMSYGRNDEISLKATSIYNMTAPLNGKIGMALFNGSTFVSFIGATQDVDFTIGYGYRTITFTGAIPSNVSNGNYQLCLASQTEGEEVPSKALAKAGNYAFYNMEISASGITLSKPTSAVALEQPSKLELVGQAVLNKNVKFKIEVRNNGVDYIDEFGVYLKPVSSLRPQARLTQPVTIPGGETVTLEITGVLPEDINKAGEYSVLATYRDNGQWKNMTADMGATITILAEGSSIEETEMNVLSAAVSGSVIRVWNAAPGEVVAFYALNGSLLQEVVADASGVAEFTPAQKGVLLVRQGSQTVKVVY